MAIMMMVQIMEMVNNEFTKLCSCPYAQCSDLGDALRTIDLRAALRTRLWSRLRSLYFIAALFGRYSFRFLLRIENPIPTIVAFCYLATDPSFFWYVSLIRFYGTNLP